MQCEGSLKVNCYEWFIENGTEDSHLYAQVVVKSLNLVTHKTRLLLVKGEEKSLAAVATSMLVLCFALLCKTTTWEKKTNFKI